MSFNLITKMILKKRLSNEFTLEPTEQAALNIYNICNI